MEPGDRVRYGRQVLCNDVGVNGQKLIQASRVAIIGAGALGCPVSLYLATAGIGYIKIIDDDVIELSNLHRQILHTENNVGQPKVLSAKNQILARNSAIEVVACQERVHSENVMELVSDVDIIVDCTDNITVRYLLNDVAVLLKKPLVSGSAISLCGQVSVYNYQSGANFGPCLRCFFPSPSLSTQSCSNDGVLGPVTGVIGSLQAMEVLKVAMQKPFSEVLSGKLLMVDLSDNLYRTIKLNENLRKNCQVCGPNAVINLQNFKEFGVYPICESNVPPPGLPTISCEEYYNTVYNKKDHVLLDVRVPLQYEICSLQNAWNVPLRDLNDEKIEQVKNRIGNKPVYVMCRRGIASIAATKLLVEKGMEKVYNINGGLNEWQNKVNPNFLMY